MKSSTSRFFQFEPGQVEMYIDPTEVSKRHFEKMREMKFFALRQRVRLSGMCSLTNF